VVYDTKKIFRGFLTIGVLCLILSVGLWYLVRTENSAWIFLAIGTATFIGLSGFSWIFSAEKKKLGPIFRFQPRVEVATFPQLKVAVPEARRRLQFSYEIFRHPDGDSNCELNYFVDDMRRPFLAQIGHGGPLRKLADDLEKIGFVVTGYDGPRNPPNQPPEPMPLKRHGSA
jgi:hypothetical protein